MSARARNIAVGVTVLVGLAVLGGMIFLFAGMPEFFSGGYRVSVHMTDSGGAKVGDTIHVAGQSIGKITGMRLAGSDPRQGVDLTLHVEKGISLPVDSKLSISQNSIMGGTWIALELGQSKQYLPTDNTARIEGGLEAGKIGGVDIGKIAQSVEGLAKGVGTLLGTNQPSVAPRVPGEQANLQTTLNRLDTTLAALNDILASKDNQENIHMTLANLKEFTRAGTETMQEVKKLAVSGQSAISDAAVTMKTINKLGTNADANFGKLTQALLKDAEDVSRTLAALDQAMNQMSRGQGTTGKLISDPHLYNNLVDLTEQMSSMLKETRAMLQQWKDKGVPLHLK